MVLSTLLQSVATYDNFLRSFIFLSSMTIVYCDNVSIVYMTANRVHHQRTKYIEIDIHFVRKKVALGQIQVLHVPSAHPYVDISSSVHRYYDQGTASTVVH